MQSWQVIFAVILAVLASGTFFISYRQFTKSGAVLTNTWLWATKEQRANMDEKKKEAEYRLARNVFFLLGCGFLMLTIGVLTLLLGLFFSIAGVLFLAVVIYAVVQSVKSGEWK